MVSELTGYQDIIFVIEVFFDIIASYPDEAYLMSAELVDFCR